MQRLGHRGAMGYCPENSLASFTKALELGCDGVELDVWLTRDEKLVVRHDGLLRLTTDSTGWIPDMLAEEVRAARCTFGGVVTTEHVPMLDDVLDLCAGKVQVNVEIKAPPSLDAIRKSGHVAAQTVARRNIKNDEVVLSSFWLPALDGACESEPKLLRALIIDSYIGAAELVKLALAHGLYALNVGKGHIEPELLEAAHKAGLRVHAWTVNEPEDVTLLTQMGVDGLLSNYPDRVTK